MLEKIFFLSEDKWEEARNNKHYDLIIIGSGFCGYAVAERALKNNPFSRILVVERGPFFLPQHFQNLPVPYTFTLGGLTETFPWTLDAKTARGEAGTIEWQHGMVPFFGGRSTAWSAWCPRPTDDEMHGWPEKVIKVAKQYFQSAEELLHVQKASMVDKQDGKNLLCSLRPVYGKLQEVVDDLLQNKGEVTGVYRVEPAPIACDAKHTTGIDFEKYSVPGDLLALMKKQEKLKKQDEGEELDLVNDCVVEKIVQQGGTATALKTSKGELPIGDAKVILAMGTLPPTTLVRNSFPEAKNVGKRFSAHFISSIIARVPREDLEPDEKFDDLEIAACYIAGKGKDYTQQFHIQLSVLSDKNPEENAQKALRYMPDVVATASEKQLKTSENYVVFVCAVLGELDGHNPENCFSKNDSDDNITTNSMLQIRENEHDRQTWEAMDTATFEILEKTLSPGGSKKVQYWHGTPDEGDWIAERPSVEERRVNALVHESSTLYIGEEESAPVDLNYLLRGSTNVYVTGGGLWPLGGSWNPTMTMVALAQHLADQLVPKTEEH